jgi:L-rhamnose isomerase
MSVIIIKVNYICVQKCQDEANEYRTEMLVIHKKLQGFHFNNFSLCDH